MTCAQNESRVGGFFSLRSFLGPRLGHQTAIENARIHITWKEDDKSALSAKACNHLLVALEIREE